MSRHRAHTHARHPELYHGPARSAEQAQCSHTMTQRLDGRAYPYRMQCDACQRLDQQRIGVRHRDALQMDALALGKLAAVDVNIVENLQIIRDESNWADE